MSFGNFLVMRVLVSQQGAGLTAWVKKKKVVPNSGDCNSGDCNNLIGGHI